MHLLTIDDFTAPDLLATNGARWRAFSDQVMGGVSRAEITALARNAGPDAVPAEATGDDAGHAPAGSPCCLRLAGEVSLDNNGGFIQAALDLSAAGVLDASRYDGVRLRIRGNEEDYVAALRTPDCVRPWQSYRAHFSATAEWRDIDLPFSAFAPHRLAPPLDVSRLRRLGLLAIGRAFRAELYLAGVWLYAR